MMIFTMPSDPALQAAVGRVSIRHAQLDRILRMTVKSIEDITPEQALDQTHRWGSAKLRKRVAELARAKLGEDPAFDRLEEILARAERATDLRNDLIHSTWAQNLDGEEMLLDGSRRRLPVPSVPELDALAAQIQGITNELNKARLEGFLREALDHAKAVRDQISDEPGPSGMPPAAAP
jgi:hypothetical protein